MRTKQDQDITIEATLIKETPDAWYLDCEGDREWFPKSYATFDKEENRVHIAPWLYEKKFPNG